VSGNVVRFQKAQQHQREAVCLHRGRRAVTRASVLTLAADVAAPATELYGSIFLFGVGIIVFSFASILIVGTLASRNLDQIAEKWEATDNDLLGKNDEKMYQAFDEEIQRREAEAREPKQSDGSHGN